MKTKKFRKIVSILLTLTFLAAMMVPMATPAAASTNYSMTKVMDVKSDGSQHAIGSLVITMDPATATEMVYGSYVYLCLPANPSGYKLEQDVANASFVGLEEKDGGADASSVDLACTQNAYQVQLKINKDLAPKDNATTCQIIMPLKLTVPGGVTGEIKLSLAAPSDSPFSGGSLVIAKNGSSSVTISSESVESVGSGGGNVGLIDITENTYGALANSGGTKALKLKLPAGVTWSGVTMTPVWGDLTAADIDITIDGDGGRTCAIDVLNESTASASFFKLQGSIEIDESTAKTGDITVAVSGATSADQSTITVGKYGDYGVTAQALSAPTITAGVVASDVGKIELDESIGGSLVKDRTITLTLPDNVKWSQLPNVDTNLSDAQSATISWAVVGTDAKMLKGTITTGGTTNPATIVLKDFEVTPAVDFTGDLKVTVGGSQGVTGELTIANVVPNVTAASATAPDVKIGLPDQALDDITITEGAAENIDSTQTGAEYSADLVDSVNVGGTAVIQLKAPSGVTFSGTPTVTVSEGDLQLDSSSVKTSDDDNILNINVKATSTTASTIKISGLKVTVDRTVPEGDMKLKVQGRAVNETLDAAGDDTIFPGHTAAAEFVAAKVVTPHPEDQTRTAVFTIGDSTFTLNGVEQTMDAAPYLKNGRTYLPIRYVAKAIGVSDDNIIWNGAEKSVVLIKGDRVVKMVVGSNTLKINGIDTTMDVAPEVVDPGRTMLPVRWVAQALGATINWDEATQTVTVN